MEWFVNAVPIIVVIGVTWFIWFPVMGYFLFRQVFIRVIEKRSNETSKVDQGKSFNISEVVGLHVIALFFSVSCNMFPYINKPPKRSICSAVETAAYYTMAALSSHFSHPNHTNIPTVEKLIEVEKLILEKDVKVVIHGGIDDILMIVATDTTGRCPRGRHFTAYMGGNFADHWSDERKGGISETIQN